MSELLRGTVKWFNDAKGFGFIEHESGKDIFIHYSVIESDGYKTLKDGEEVEYILADGEKGLHAERVIRVNAPQEATPTLAQALEVEAVNDVNADNELSTALVDNDVDLTSKNA
jgi:CspA family cold shock protein